MTHEEFREFIAAWGETSDDAYVAAQAMHSLVSRVERPDWSPLVHTAIARQYIDILDNGMPPAPPRPWADIWHDRWVKERDRVDSLRNELALVRAEVAQIMTQVRQNG